MKHFRRLLVFVIILGIVYVVLFPSKPTTGGTIKDTESIFAVDILEDEMAMAAVLLPTRVVMDGKQMNLTSQSIYVDDNGILMIKLQALQETFDCAIKIYDNSKLIIERNTKELTIESGIQMLDNDMYVPLETIADGFDYGYEVDEDNKIIMLSKISADPSFLPVSYDYRDEERVPVLKNQGSLGTCWAVASVSALESSLLPRESLEFAADHMSIHNSFSANQYDGGDYTMSMAYLTSWQGPILEQDDPYGDEQSPEDIEAVIHVQEIQLIEEKNYEAIKEAIYKYGAVQSSLHLTLDAPDSDSIYYSRENSAYCYTGDEEANHDIIIIGWDDNYPAANFREGVTADGAFICQNSWGERFGENGIFYVSYQDTNIGAYNAVYTRIEDKDNYNNIYQSDLCGFVGQIGYGEKTALFANAYTSSSEEMIKAVGFYATAKDTTYKVYVVRDFADESSFKNKEFIQMGGVKNAGYYTIDLVNAIEIAANQKFAIVIEITSPGAIHPVAIEYYADEITSGVDLSDGEGYLSYAGGMWADTEEEYDCNVCLKVYTDDINK